MVGLVGGVWLDIKRTIALDFSMTYNGRTIALEFKTHLHPVEQSCFVHIVDVLELVLIQDLPNLGPLTLDHFHVDRSALSKAAVRPDPMAVLEGLEPAVGKLKSSVVGIQTIQDLLCTLFEEITAHVDAVLIGVEPLRQSLLHFRILNGALAFLAEIDVVCHLEQLSGALEGARDG